MVKKAIELEFVVRIAYRVSILNYVVCHVAESLLGRLSNVTHEVWSKPSEASAKGVNRHYISPTYDESNMFRTTKDRATIPFHTQVCIDNAYLWQRGQV